jgi:hypothetical protein
MCGNCLQQTFWHSSVAPENWRFQEQCWQVWEFLCVSTCSTKNKPRLNTRVLCVSSDTVIISPVKYSEYQLISNYKRISTNWKWRKLKINLINIRPKILLFAVIIYTCIYTHSHKHIHNKYPVSAKQVAHVQLNVTIYGRMRKNSAGWAFKMKVTPAVGSYNGS